MKLLLTDEEIGVAKAEAERLYWTFKAHPRFEKEEYLLEAQIKKLVKILKKDTTDGAFAISEELWEVFDKEV